MYWQIHAGDGNFQISSTDDGGEVQNGVAFLRTAVPLDYDTVDAATAHSITVWLLGVDPAGLSASEQLAARIEFEVLTEMRPLNDNEPVCDGEFSAQVLEGRPAGDTGVVAGSMVIGASDLDIDAILTFEIVSGNDDGLFTINSVTGQVETTASIDYESHSGGFALGIQVSDGGDPIKTTICTLDVEMIDTNDNSPVWDEDGFEPLVAISRDSTPGIALWSLLATDDDSGAFGALAYEIVAQRANDALLDPEDYIITLEMDAGEPSRAVLSLATSLCTPETDLVTVVDVSVRVSDGGDPPLTATTDLQLVIAGVNPGAPVFNQSLIRVGLLDGTSAGAAVAHLSATDEDGPCAVHGALSYSLADSADAALVALDPDSGALALAADLSIASQGHFHSIAVVVSDNGVPSPRFAEAEVRITVYTVPGPQLAFAGAGALLGAAEAAAGFEIASTVGLPLLGAPERAGQVLASWGTLRAALPTAVLLPAPAAIIASVVSTAGVHARRPCACRRAGGGDRRRRGRRCRRCGHCPPGG